MEEKILNNHFRYGYCATCHSCQGASIGDRITIHEWNNSKLVTRQWLWTAITRCRDFKQVYFYLDDGQLAEIKQNFLTNYLKNKVEGYKQQDKKAGRNIYLKSYITTEWCFERLCGNCQKCGKQFDIDVNSGCISTDFTAQRKDNEMSHTTDNCIAYCTYGNCSSC